MPTYLVSCYTTGEQLEFTLDAPTAERCTDLAFDYFSLHATREHGELDEIVVRPPEGEHIIDGREGCTNSIRRRRGFTNGWRRS